jgi:hypothetical protein
MSLISRSLVAHYYFMYDLLWFMTMIMMIIMIHSSVIFLEENYSSHLWNCSFTTSATVNYRWHADTFKIGWTDLKNNSTDFKTFERELTTVEKCQATVNFLVDAMNEQFQKNNFFPQTPHIGLPMPSPWFPQLNTVNGLN